MNQTHYSFYHQFNCILLSAILLGTSACAVNNRDNAQEPPAKPAAIEPGGSGQGSTPAPGSGVQPRGTVDLKLNDKIYVIPVAQNELKVATYNLENLFDTVHDNDKSDYTFTPHGTPGKAEYCKTQTGFYKKQCETTDWQQPLLNLKLNQIKKALESQGPLPDILGVQEIENSNVAEQLRVKLGYDAFVLHEGPDQRGIDTALFFQGSKLKAVDDGWIRLPVKDSKGNQVLDKATRDILWVEFEVAGALATHAPGTHIWVAVNHWPSLGHGTEERLWAAEHLREAIDARRAKAASEEELAKLVFIALGDFNTLSIENPNPFANLITQRRDWEGSLFDTQLMLRKPSNAMVKKLKAIGFKRHSVKEEMPTHSYWYSRENAWQQLDRILFSQNVLEKDSLVRLDLSSFRIVAASFMTDNYRFDQSYHEKSFFKGSALTRVPKRYDFSVTTPGEQGYSDHLPVVVKLKFGAMKELPEQSAP